MKKFLMFLLSFAFTALLMGLPEEANGSCIACTIYDEGRCAPWGIKNPTTKCFKGMDSSTQYPTCAYGKSSVKECPVFAGPD
ncbi:MAG TPA: hypothetical protein PKC30_01310 [Saprospiraceae bacterium]|nr:hypothetical protein [Saprospiraceae bacterium]